jgi:hypothetical protein
MPDHPKVLGVGRSIRHTAYLAALLLAVSTGGANAAFAAPAEGESWRPGVSAARAYASKRAGTVSFALRTRGHLYGYDSRRTVSSASVVKAMLMVAYLNRRGVRGRQLDGDDRALLAPMIQRSANAAANRVYVIVGSDGLYRLARRVGMRKFTTLSVWGGSQITAADQTKFFLEIERWVVPRHRDTALRLLGSIVPRQRWGIARAIPPGWAFYFKGGWTSVVQNQAGLLRRGDRRLAIAVLTSDSPGPYYGRETERGVALRLLRGLDRSSVPAE